MRERISKALVEQNVPSVAVAVVREGKIIWEQGFGWADRENRVLSSEHTLYSVASISKPITATGFMVLKDRKLVDLDKPANDYLGEAKLRARVGDAADATLRRVANHTSGMGTHYQVFYVNDSYRPPTRDETIRRFGNLLFVPGEHYQYCNLGYGLIDYIIERTSGKSYADFMREEVFLPLGMMHSSIDVAPGLEPHQAKRYKSDGRLIPFYEFDHPGASAVYTSAHDLARFAMFHMKEHLQDQRPILTDATIDEMQAPTATAPNGSGYGVGWASAESPRGYRIVDHSGSMPGVSTLCSLVPSKRVAVVVLTNTNCRLPHTLTPMILKIVLPESGADEPAGRRARNEEQPAGKFVPTAELIGQWQGRAATYKGETPLTMSIRDTGDVHLRLGDQFETLLNNPSFRGGFLRGDFGGDIGTEENRDRPYHMSVEMKLLDGVLGGSLIVITIDRVQDTSVVCHWVELKRDKPAAEPEKPDAAPAGK